VEPRGPLDLSLILACYNEERILAANVAEILRCLDTTRLAWEIIFVDDASPDGTTAVIDRLVAAHPDRAFRVIRHARNTGRGAAVTDGFRAATGEVAGFIDADLEVGPWYIPACVAAIRDGADVAIGRRSYRVTFRGLARHVLSAGYAALVRAALPARGLADTETGYKFFRRSALLPLLDATRDPGWFWDTEIMVRAWARGLRIAEIPCLYVRNFRKVSTVRVVRDSLGYLRRLRAFRREAWPALAAERRAAGRG